MRSSAGGSSRPRFRYTINGSISAIRFPHCAVADPELKPPTEVIAVLKDWRELGDCINTLEMEGLPLHSTLQKNWDHMMIRGYWTLRIAMSQ